uniref:PetP protein n=1 Tax=Scinaia undulata TaxID=1884664 RepID=A0A1G4NXK3_9FLOR|nr:hypothetical protein P8465_pgp082 [Scinaia undulata]SCW23421.1 petP [Scinaia undulata]
MLSQEQTNTITKIYQVTSKCPDEIIYNNNKICIIKGFRKVTQNSQVPIVEFYDTTRMWVLPKEMIE